MSRTLERPIVLNIKAAFDPDKKSVQMIFHDNAKYLSELQQSQVFNMFYISSENDSPQIKSLSLVKHIVEMYNGQLTLETAKRLGVKISINFKDILPRQLN